MTIVEVIAPEFDTSGDVPVLTGMTTSATTNISGQDALGINNPTVSRAGFDAVSNENGNEGNDLNPGESVTFTFDQDVQFTTFELESVLAGDSFDILVDGVPVLETTGDDATIDDLGDLAGFTIAAGTEITIAVDGELTTTSVRLESFEVVIVPESEPEPEPVVLCDVNRDGIVNFLDISPFIGVLSTGGDQAEADCNEDGMVNFLDISPFIVALSSGGGS